MPTLILGRGIMGIGAALIYPATLAILTAVFTKPSERAQAIAIWAGFSRIGVAAGPTTGGWLLENFWWGSVFFVNIPVVLIGLALTVWIPNPGTSTHRPSIGEGSCSRSPPSACWCSPSWRPRSGDGPRR